MGWEERAAEDKQRYDVENKNWLESGGAEAIKAAKKEAKAAKRASKAGGDSKKVKSSSKVEKSNSSVNLTSAGSGGGFKSKEFIESESSSGGDNSSDDEEHTKNISFGANKSLKNIKSLFLRYLRCICNTVTE